MINGERLRALRKQRGATQRAIAEDIGVAENSVRRFELGLANAKLGTVVALADLFNVSVDYLIGRSDNPQRI